MNLKTFEELTGTTVSTAKVAFYKAQIRRTKSMLETMLGFTLCPNGSYENLYKELGKSQLECACPGVNIQNLLPADDVVDSYRLYPYNKDDQYFAVDPFIKLNKVKLVYVKPGAEPNGVTLKTFDEDEIRVQMGRGTFSKYIEHCKTCLCSCDCQDCVQLAVDAEWAWDSIKDIPEDLLYVWVDMISYYSDKKNNIKSESIDTHSYTKFEKVAPETEPSNLAIIKRYAGPYGSVMVMPI